jgi:ribosomal protein L11 methyltransferase
LYSDEETKVSTVSVYSLQRLAAPTLLLKELKSGLTNIRRCGLNSAPGKISLKKILHESWAHSWKRHFKPIEIGNALLIKPSWNRRKPGKGQKMVVLDPGLSFGTGQHATTGFCLRQLVANLKRETGNTKQSILDIGTGSGILAIAAAKLDYAPVRAFDFDSESVRVARANARKNGVLHKIQITRQDLTRLAVRSAMKYDIVCANLISNLLIAERERIISRVKPGGTLVLAGILKTEFGLVQLAYEQSGLKLISAKAEKEWRSGAFRF